ncbi:MAG: glycerol kinase GlpK [Pirellulaceae bacterium]
MMHYLAIDQSTSATKALLFNASWELVSKASKDHRQIYPQPGWVEHDAEEIWLNTLAVVKEVVSGRPQPTRLSISNQRETVVVFDRATGKPLHNAIVWQCRRGDAICSQLKADHQDASVRRKSGLVIDTYFPASKVRWLIENVPEIKQALADGTALVGTVDTYLIYRLTNGQVFATDHTNACRTLLYDIQQLDWSESLCELFHVPLSALAEIRDSNTSFGTTDVAGALDSPIPIRGVMGDSQASLFAMGCHSVGDTKVTFGTGSSLLLNVGMNIPQPNAGTVATVAWVIDGRPTYCLEGIISYSAATLQWLRNQLQLIDSYEETQTLAESIENNAGVYLVPAFAGLSAPYWSPDARAAIVGLTALATKAHVVRAALESIAYQVRDLLEMMREQAGGTTRLIHADGGATSNGFLMQFLADMIDAEVRTSLVAESSPLGAVLCGAIGSEAISIEQLKLPGSGQSYHRQISSETADDSYAGWQRAVASVLDNAPPKQLSQPTTQNVSILNFT